MVHLYKETPAKAESFTDMFTQGLFYGRLRLNSFGYRWRKEVTLQSGEEVRKNHAIAAVGGSFIYKSAYYNGLGVGFGLYTTHAKGSLPKHEANLYKSGRDSLSRYDLATRGKRGISVLAQSYLSYKYQENEFKIGRQVFESFLTKSNDTKMIPNTFEGVTFESKALHKTSLKMAYFTKEKLRDHSSFHHIFAYADQSSDGYTQFSQNDDSAMHRGLTLDALNKRDIEDRLMLFEMRHRGLRHAELKVNYSLVPNLLSFMMIQADYSFDVGDWTVVPVVRYMRQFDIGAGGIGGASIKLDTSGYYNPDKLNATLHAMKVDMVSDTLKLRFGYSAVGDKADIVTPWRGFPTGGFTRAMGQHNWYANTKSYMFQVDYAPEIMSDFKIISRFVVQDFDDKKAATQADSNVFTFDVAKVFDNHIYMKTRYAHVMGKDDTIASNGFRKLDPSYDEVRVEMNYLF